MGRLPKHLGELADDTLDNAADWMDETRQARKTMRRADVLAKRLIDAAADGLMTPDELLECLKGLVEVRREAAGMLTLGERSEPRSRRICANTEIVIRQRGPLRKAALTHTVRV